MHEHVGTVLGGDEAEPLLGVEPLHGSSRHCYSLLPWPDANLAAVRWASGLMPAEGTARSHSVWRNEPKTACEPSRTAYTLGSRSPPRDSLPTREMRPTPGWRRFRGSSTRERAHRG